MQLGALPLVLSATPQGGGVPPSFVDILAEAARSPFMALFMAWLIAVILAVNRGSASGHRLPKGYVRPFFRAERAATIDFMRRTVLATVVAPNRAGHPHASVMPLAVRELELPDKSKELTLVGFVAKDDPFYTTLSNANQESLVLFDSPKAPISPAWYKQVCERRV